MSEACDSNCSTCNIDCDSRSEKSLLEETNALNQIKKVYAVVSGKGGVGKSSVTAMLAVALSRSGYKVGVLDADITGPSIPKAFGVSEKPGANELGIFPIESQMGIRLMSINLLLPDQTDPVVWRGPVISGAVKQFWTDVIWGELDYLLVDMPPGTGDVSLTVFQSLPIDGIIMVTSPQDLVGMIVSKAVKMAEMMKIPVVGLVENMSYFTCPDCGKRHTIFGESNVDRIAAGQGLKVLAKLPIDPELSKACDLGKVESYDGASLDAVIEAL